MPRKAQKNKIESTKLSVVKLEQHDIKHESPLPQIRSSTKVEESNSTAFQIIAHAGEEPRLEKRPRKSKKVSKFIDDEADESDEESLIKNTSDLVKRKLAE